MWRLNFLVVLVCIVLQNNYMLYYICPMHTLFTIMVYAALGLGHRYNKSNAGITCKSVLFFILLSLCHVVVIVSCCCYLALVSCCLVCVQL